MKSAMQELIEKIEEITKNDVGLSFPSMISRIETTARFLLAKEKEQAKQNAIGFAEWIRTRAVTGNDGTWHYEDNQDGCLKIVTSDQLYSPYQQQKQKV